MSVLARFDGIVIHFMRLPALGTRLYAVHGEEELVVSLCPLRIVQGEASPWVEREVMDWVRQNRRSLTAPESGRSRVCPSAGRLVGGP